MHIGNGKKDVIFYPVIISVLLLVSSFLWFRKKHSIGFLPIALNIFCGCSVWILIVCISFNRIPLVVLFVFPNRQQTEHLASAWVRLSHITKHINILPYIILQRSLSLSLPLSAFDRTDYPNYVNYNENRLQIIQYGIKFIFI